MIEHTRPARTQAAKITPAGLPARPTPWPSALPTARAGMSSGGRPLDRKTQTEMSARFGHDFSSVRIHTDSRAEDAAQAMSANAYTLGTDIVFGQGKYTLGSSDTELLLAHELTHVVQQQTLGGGDWGRPSRHSDASEREADALAAQVMRGQSVQARAMPGAAIARDEAPPDPADTPSVREKDKPGGPTDWGDKSLSLKWGWGSFMPKSADVDPGMGDPLTIPNVNPFQLNPPKLGPPPSTEFQPKPAPDTSPMLPLYDPLHPPYLTDHSANQGGLLGKPFDPSQPYGDPSTWQPSAVAPGAF